MDHEVWPTGRVWPPGHFRSDPRSWDQRIRPERKGCRHPAALEGDRAMTDGVHARVHLVQAAASQPALDHVPGESKTQKLPPSNEPMLPSSQVGRGAVEIGRSRRTSWAHGAPYLRRVFHAADGAAG
jgi:hypothetical protein